MNLDRDTLVQTAQALLALADAMAPEEPVTFFGETLHPGNGWRQMVKIFDAERLRHLALDAPFGRESDGTPKPPPALSACGLLVDTATREGWPGPHGHVFSRWDYVRGLQALYQDAGGIPAPRYENKPQQLEDDIRWLCASDPGRSWLARLENRAVTGAAYVALAGHKPVERMPDGTLREISQ